MKKKPVKVPMCPRTPLAKRFSAIMHRREGSPWHPKWINAFVEIVPLIKEQDLVNVERRYKALWPPDIEKNSLRHDLFTLINNFLFSELDRANIWAERNPVKTVRKVIPVAFVQSEPYAEQEGDAESVARFNQEREARGRESAFAKVKREMQG